MKVVNSNLSNVKELRSIGYKADYLDYLNNSPDLQKQEMHKNYKTAMKNIDSSFVIASIITDQKDAKKLLLDNGFKQDGKSKKNNNSGNNIWLFVKSLRKKGIKPNSSKTCRYPIQIMASKISCGVEELIIKNKVSVKHYETLKNMLKYYLGAFIISSCLSEEKDKIKLLTDNDFEKISKVNGTILLRWRNSKKNPCTHPPGWY